MCNHSLDEGDVDILENIKIKYNTFDDQPKFSFKRHKLTILIPIPFHNAHPVEFTKKNEFAEMGAALLFGEEKKHRTVCVCVCIYIYIHTRTHTYIYCIYSYTVPVCAASPPTPIFHRCIVQFSSLILQEYVSSLTL
jgi:hypothetical protein